MSEELKPCPFGCTEPAPIPLPRDGWWYVFCPSCGCESRERRTRQHAAESWNTRADLARLPEELVDRLRMCEHKDHNGFFLEDHLALLRDILAWQESLR